VKVTATEIPDVLVLEPAVFKDERGLFFEGFNQKKFENIAGPKVRFGIERNSRRVVQSYRLLRASA
jgi:dTDP-4-dehydrorhamnose 3,5-epimerase